ncbi:MFS transporter [Lacticaseibacillus zhaodongensis]|uniref:MFS transporter n=1 Tax=Lacticaseibacillus zhaodongensis TaxID=2668065 RepID=UPI0022A91AA7|nr:MFS transporter [Lacticaseibacillus zhaodongensis]
MVSFMSTIDASIVNIAVPQLSHDFGVPMNQAEWVVSVYLVLICVLLIFFGNVSDQIGRIPVFQVGTIIFTVGSLGCGLSNSLPMLLIMRVLQAVGSSMTMATNFGIITEIFPRARHGIALGVNSSFVQIGNIMGPGLGGLILAAFTWHDIFYINVPLGIIAFILGRKLFPKEPVHLQKIKIDWPGYAAYALAIVAFFVGIYWGQDSGYTRLPIIGLFVCTLIMIGGFVYRENHTPAPLLNLRIFKNPAFTIGVLTTMMVFAVSYFNNMILPFYLQETLGYSSAIAGMILMAAPFVNVFAAPLGGQLSDHIGPERVSRYGLGLFLIPMIIFILIEPSWGALWLVIALMIFGFANGTFQNNPMIMSNAGQEYQGIAGSIASLSRNLGMSLGLSLATSTLYWGISRQAGRHITSYPHAHPEWFIAGMHISYYFALGLIVIALGLLTWLLRSTRRAAAANS